MQTEAVFENIGKRIEQEIGKAKRTIFIAVAWFTNQTLFNELVNKAKNGRTVQLIISNDQINNNSSINFDELLIENSRVYKIGNEDSVLMHNKFCVIDNNVVITGSYNWSYKAEINFENVIVTTEDHLLASQFVAEFSRIRKQYFPDEEKIEFQFPIEKIMKRMEILKNYIFLEDLEELEKETSKLKQYNFDTQILEILSLIENKEYGAAILNIQSFISNNKQLSIWSDPEIAALKLEIKNLENQLNGYDNEKIDLLRIVADFQHRHTNELGSIILEILRLRKLKFKDDKKKYEEAVNDEKQYQEQVETEKDIIELPQEQREELKKKYRKATTLCHPDKFMNETVEIQQKAEAIFKELNYANENNDLQRVSEILANLEKGILTTSIGDKLADKERLKATIIELRKKVKALEAEIIAIKQSETFITIKEIDDLNEYFKILKKKLQVELEELRTQIE